ncbi:trimeric intracellular cation channel family protein [Azonexus hydrophilus]|jgi:uncharacterized membrane protein YeiH|uniref:TRIC cation channel family protein n=1 Tax=Azonexus hydrophilus TaxID=418702 RepID=A0ABZ2XFS5_9RHOO|nr:TRIC cation channel family protein [Azonexus hydrophilus]MBS4017979.1 TRIC cation channel family protein [Dechloromonas sp.]
MSMDALLYWVGMSAVAVNALTGVLDASRKQMDLIGALLVAVATALGGGTVRDLLLDRNVFWVADQAYLMAALATGMIAFFVVRRVNVPHQLFQIPDAIGLALFTIIGTQIALQWHVPWLAASLMGVITGVVGGVLRDILCNDVPSIFLKGELYATAAWVGALSLIAMQELGLPAVNAAWAAMGIVFLLRLLSLRLGITMPVLGAPR